MKAVNINLLVLFCIVLAFKSNVNANLRVNLNKIKTTLGPKVYQKVNNVLKLIPNTSSDTIDLVSKQIENVAAAASSMTSSDGIEIASGILQLMSSVAVFIPKFGIIISSVLSMISEILLCFGGGQKDVGTIVREEIQKAFDNYVDADITAEMDGVERIFKVSQAYLKGVNEYQLAQHEVAAVSANVPIYSGVRFLGIVSRNSIENMDHTDDIQVLRAIKYINLYAMLATFRSAVLTEMTLIINDTKHSYSTATGIYRVREAEENHDKEFIKVLTKPLYSQIKFHTKFNPSDWPLIKTFLNYNKLPFPDYYYQTRSTYYGHSLIPAKYTSYAMGMRGDSFGTMVGYRRSSAGSQEKFYFDRIKDNIFHIRSAKWRNWYVYMKTDGYCRGWEGKPGPAGEWKLVQYEDHRFLISPLKWPDYYLYMMSDSIGHIKGWKGNPGSQGQWLIT